MTDHEKKLADAKARVASFDENDGAEERSIGTLIAALNAGLSGNDDSSAYDALVMLKDIQSVISNIPMLNVSSLKTILKALDEGNKVSIKLIPIVDPNRN